MLCTKSYIWLVGVRRARIQRCTYSIFILLSEGIEHFSTTYLFVVSLCRSSILFITFARTFLFEPNAKIFESPNTQRPQMRISKIWHKFGWNSGMRRRQETLLISMSFIVSHKVNILSVILSVPLLPPMYFFFFVVNFLCWQMWLLSIFRRPNSNTNLDRRWYCVRHTRACFTFFFICWWAADASKAYKYELYYMRDGLAIRWHDTGYLLIEDVTFNWYWFIGRVKLKHRNSNYCRFENRFIFLGASKLSVAVMNGYSSD